MVANQMFAFYNHLQYQIKKVTTWFLILMKTIKKIEGF